MIWLKQKEFLNYDKDKTKIIEGCLTVIVCKTLCNWNLKK